MWNRLPALMADTDAAVLHEIKDTLLNRKVVERALDQAEALLLDDRTDEQRAALEAQLADIDAAVRRLTAAIVKGGELTALVVVLKTHERQRREVSARLAALHSPSPGSMLGRCGANSATT